MSMTRYELKYKCRFCGTIYTNDIKRDPIGIRYNKIVMYSQIRGLTKPPLVIIHACSGYQTGVADFIGQVELNAKR